MKLGAINYGRYYSPYPVISVAGIYRPAYSMAFPKYLNDLKMSRLYLLGFCFIKSYSRAHIIAPDSRRVMRLNIVRARIG